MINVNDIQKAFDSLANIPQQGNVTPEQRNILMNNAVNALYKQRLGLPEAYEFQTALPKIAYARTKKIHADLTPFRKRKTVVISNPEFVESGLLPADMYFETSVKYYTVVKSDDAKARELERCGCRQENDAATDTPAYRKYVGTLDLVEEDKWAARANSSIIKKAMYLPFSDGWKLLFPVMKPKYIEVEYLKRPTKAVWNYDIIDDVEVYKEAGSVHVEFDDMLKSEIVDRMLKEYGLLNDDTLDIEFANQKIANGQ